MKPRLSRLVPGELDDEQRAVYDGITGGDRAKGTQHFPLTAADGSLHGPFGVMLHAPGVGQALQQLGAGLRFGTDLTARAREIAILQVAAVRESGFEWWAHERIARAAGVPDDVLDGIRADTFTGEGPEEEAAVELCRTVLRRETVGDELFSRLSAVLSTRRIIELVVMVGYYETLAQLMAVFEIEPPDEAGTE